MIELKALDTQGLGKHRSSDPGNLQKPSGCPSGATNNKSGPCSDVVWSAQMNWGAVLELAMDAQRPEQFGSSDPGEAQNAAIRRHAIAVIDAVDRNGLVAPWTAVPHLLALTTDPNRSALVCSKSCQEQLSGLLSCCYATTFRCL